MNEIKILHLFPKLLSLYGEYGNIAVLSSVLKDAGYPLTVDQWENGELCLDGYDFIYIGSGTEDNLLEAVNRLMPHKEAVNASVMGQTLWLATGNAMTIFGASISRRGAVSPALGCLDYTTDVQDNTRFLGDVVTQQAFGAPMVGFVNTSCVFHGISDPFTEFCLGAKLGNSKQDGADGILTPNFYGTQLIGPVLAKNPHFLCHVCEKITKQPFSIPADTNIQKAYQVAISELQKRMA